MTVDRVAIPPKRSFHPTLEELTAFGLGTCDESQLHEIEQHVLECSLCCQMLAELPDDGLLTRLASRKDECDTNCDALSGFGETDTGSKSWIDPSSEKEFAESIANDSKYDLIRKLGSGGMGDVYLAKHRFMHRMVALKVISPRMMQSHDAKSRFRREVQIAAKLSHPNVAAAFDAHDIGDHLVLVSEYFEGENLNQLIQRETLEVNTVCKIARQIALGLAHAHASGLVHRDIKPQNVLVSNQGEVKVVDFGLARYCAPDGVDQHGLTSAGMILGTPDYISPEQANQRTVDHRADIYSLGCTLYHLIAGSPPFPAGSRIEKLAQHIRNDPQPLAAIRPDVTPELDACVARMMEKAPENRFQSADEVAKRLEPFCVDEKIEPPPAAEGPSEGDRNWRKHALILTGLLLMLIAGAFAVQGKTDSKSSPSMPEAVSESQLLPRPPDEWSSKNIPGGWPVRILAIVPPDPLMRDVHLLYIGLDELGIPFELTTASSVSELEHFPGLVSLDQVDPSRFHGVIFFGHESPIATELSQPESRRHLKHILDSMNADGRPIASLGTGLWTLTHLGAIRGKQVAACKHSSPAFRTLSGATWSRHQTVVVDENLITGTNTTDAKPFLRQLMKMIAGYRPSADAISGLARILHQPECASTRFSSFAE